MKSSKPQTESGGGGGGIEYEVSDLVVKVEGLFGWFSH